MGEEGKRKRGRRGKKKLQKKVLGAEAKKNPALRFKSFLRPPAPGRGRLSFFGPLIRHLPARHADRHHHGARRVARGVGAVGERPRGHGLLPEHPVRALAGLLRRDDLHDGVPKDPVDGLGHADLCRRGLVLRVSPRVLRMLPARRRVPVRRSCWRFGLGGVTSFSLWQSG